MATTIADIQSAIMARLSANWTTTNVSWPGASFNPLNKEYIQPRIIWTDTKQSTLGENGLNMVKAILHINVFVPIGIGAARAYVIVDLIRALFPRGQRLAVGSSSYKIVFGTSGPVGSIEDEIWYQVPVECGFWNLESA